MRSEFLKRDLVLLGGGHAHVHVLKSMGMTPLPGVRVTLITRGGDTPYSGMLPGFIAGYYRHEECYIDLRRLAAFAGARLILDEAVGLDRERGQVMTRGHPPFRYDVLSIDIGSTPTIDNVPGAADFATPVKPIDRFEAQWSKILARLLKAEGKVTLALVGGGVGGVELAFAVRERLGALVRILLLTAGEPLPHLSPGPRRRVLHALQGRGIEVVGEAEVTGVEKGALVARDGRRFPYDELLWVTEARAAPWLAQTGLALDGQGFIAVDETLRSINDPRIFAAGDVAAMLAHPREKAGVFAVRQGPPLTENLRLLLKGEPPRRFIPQRRFLSLIGTGGGHAIAVRGRFSAEGAVLWRLKTAIDRRWMAKYRELPVMEEEPDMRCGGCGAKVPAEVLARVMTRLGRVEGPEDAAIVATPPARRLLQSVDFFRAFLPDPYLFGRIGANHALNDIFAMGGKPLTVLAIATVPAAADALVEEDLFHMLRGGLDQIEEAGARLIGGHSAEGKELALGFAVTGSGGEGDRFLLKGGLKQGDRLLLTKPLGTGTLLAAEMRGRARAPWIEAAIASMLRSNAAASIILRDHGVSACTDVTGFGLLGHLVEMLRASKVEAGLSLDAIPVIEGAQATAAAGILSTGQPGNLAFSAHTLDFGEMGRHPSLPLLFDPQTSGGLLAGVPAEEAASCLEALRARGYDAAEIGRIEGDASVRVRLS